MESKKLDSDVNDVQESKRLTILLIRHGIRYPKKVPEGWPLSEEISKESGNNLGSLTKLGGININ